MFAVVPSVTHSSVPFVPSLAVNTRTSAAKPVAFTKFAGFELPEPGLMSFKSFVSAGTKSLKKSSVPRFVAVLSVATKKTLPAISTIDEGFL